MTAEGNDNEGGLTLTYGYEDTDTIGTKSVFNASDSKLFCSVRDYMKDDLDRMYLALESKLAWSSARILKKFEEYQGVKPERLVIADMRRKYFRTYEDNGTTSYLPMMNGDKKHQRRQFEKYHDKYIASKHIGAACTADVMTIRGYTPTVWTGVKPDGTFRIKPYADTYIVTKYGSNIVQVRAKRGQTYEIQSPISSMNDTEVYVYNASLMQSIGSIAAFYPGYVDFGQGIKLTDLQVGSSVSGYSNTNLTDFDIGNNILLEHLNLQNVPNLKKSISLKNCSNLCELYAEGSGITGIEFADGGKIAVAHLPAVNSLTVKNLRYLTDFTMTSYENLNTLVYENSPAIDVLDLIEQAVNLNRVRIAGIAWELSGTDLLDKLAKMSGIDENGYAVTQSVLIGKVNVPVMREQLLLKYRSLWPDLEITYSTLVQQYVWTFVNYDDSVLDVQYIDKGDKAVDPVTREQDPIAVPTQPSSVSTVFTFSGWDTEFTTVFGNQTVRAVYDETLRTYTVRYMNKGNILKSEQAEYGTNVLYDGDIPTYTAEESAYKYFWFTGWDKSGYVDGDKDINPVYDTCEYTANYFDGKDFSTLRPVEIYAMLQTGNEGNYVVDMDKTSFTLGNDFDYSDIEQQVIVDTKQVFGGSSYLDTGISLFGEDRSFVLAIDYKFLSGSGSNTVLAQCYETNGMSGFRLWNNNGVKFAWSTASTDGAAFGVREMLVLRHIKGDNGMYVYQTNKGELEQKFVKLDRSKSTATAATLVFGASKADDGEFESFAKGNVYWAKIWYTDLGEDACKQLAAWPHEQRTFSVSGFKRFYLSDNTSKRCSITFLGDELMDEAMPLHSVMENTGGWDAFALNRYLNTRLPLAMPVEWKQLIKKARVPSSAGGKSKDITTSDCWFAVPAIAEMDPNVTSEPYCYEGTAISYMTSSAARIRKTEDGEAKTYWTRSPNVTYGSYCYVITENGDGSGYYYPSDSAYVCVMFSI